MKIEFKEWVPQELIDFHESLEDEYKPGFNAAFKSIIEAQIMANSWLELGKHLQSCTDSEKFFWDMYHIINTYTKASRKSEHATNDTHPPQKTHSLHRVRHPMRTFISSTFAFHAPCHAV